MCLITYTVCLNQGQNSWEPQTEEDNKWWPSILVAGTKLQLDPWVTLHVLKSLAEYITKTQCQVFKKNVEQGNLFSAYLKSVYFIKSIQFLIYTTVFEELGWHS